MKTGSNSENDLPDCIVPLIPTMHSVARAVKYIHKYQVVPLFIHVCDLFEPTTPPMISKMKEIVEMIKSPWGNGLYTNNPIPGSPMYDDADYMNKENDKHYFLHLDVTLVDSLKENSDFVSDVEKWEIFVCQCYELAKQYSCSNILWPVEFEISPVLVNMIQALNITILKMKELDDPSVDLMKFTCLDSELLANEISQREFNSEDEECHEMTEEIIDHLSGFHFDPRKSVFEVLDCGACDDVTFSCDASEMDDNEGEETDEDEMDDNEMHDNEMHKEYMSE